MAVERLAASLYSARNGNINSDETKKKVGEAAVGTSAAAAAGRKAGFSMFKSSQKAYNLSGELIDNIKLANKPIKETKVLFGSFGRTAKKYAAAFSEWVQKAPVIGKIVKTKVFMGSAKLLGSGLALLTLATGLTNIASTATTAYDKHIKSSKFLNSLDKDENSEN